MLAIVSINKFKYSETFIESHRKYLNTDILNLYNGYLPTTYSMDGMVTEDKIDSLGSLLMDKRVDVVLAEYGPSGVAMTSVCKEMGIPLMVHFHGYDAYRDDVLSTHGKEYLTMFENAAAVVGVSKDMVEQLKKLGCPVNILHHVPYGIDLNIFHQQPNSNSSKQFVSCGRFVAKKGPEFTIHAFARVHQIQPDTSLVMIGDGEMLEECKYLVRKLGLEGSIIFRGALEAGQIAQIFAESLAFLQHSMVTEMHDSEGTPLVIMEAGASGLPVIATRHGGIPDVVENGQDGFLVNERDVEAMANKMIFLLNDREQSRLMGRHLQKKIMENYSMDRYIKDLKKIIDQVKNK